MMVWIYIILSLMSLALLVSFIPWRKWAENYFSPNSTKAYIYIEMGELTECVEGWLEYSNEKGAFYTYQWRKINLTVLVPTDYDYKWLHTRRMVRLAHPGDGIASYWSNQSIENENQVSGFDLDAVIRGNVGVDLVRTIFNPGKAMSTMKIILLIVGALVILYFLSKQFGFNIIPGQSVNTPKPITPAGQTTEPIPHAEVVKWPKLLG